MAAVDTVRNFYTSLAAGDVTTLSGLFADELAWTEAKGFPYYSGTWTSFAEIAEKLLGPIGRDWDGFAATPAEFLVTDDGRVVTIGTYSGAYRATGKLMRAAFAHVWRVSNERITRFHVYRHFAHRPGDEVGNRPLCAIHPATLRLLRR